MEILLTTNEIWQVLKGAAFILLIVFAVYSIIFMKNLVKTIKSTNKILEDVEIITKITADKSKEINKVIDDAVSSVGCISESIKGNQSKLAAFAVIINTLATLKGVKENIKK